MEREAILIQASGGHAGPRGHAGVEGSRKRGWRTMGKEEMDGIEEAFRLSATDSHSVNFDAVRALIADLCLLVSMPLGEL